MSTQRRFALIIASDSYNDKKLKQLKAPIVDAKKLGELLEKSPVGTGYKITLIKNQQAHLVRREILRFFKNSERDDLRLLYFAGHGYKSLDDGHLYLATIDTNLDEYEETTIPARFINNQMHKSKSSQIIVILDCCYSGAFGREMTMTARADAKDLKITINEDFSENKSSNKDSGCVVLTSANAMQFSWEGDIFTKEEQATSEATSVYTNLLIEGIESMEADKDGDGNIRCVELNDYIKEKLREKGYPQKPEFFLIKGDVTIAYSKKKRKVDSLHNTSNLSEEIDYLVKLGFVRLKESNPTLALNAFNKILKLKPHHGNALFGKALSLHSLRRFEESLGFFDESLIIEPENQEILIAKGLAMRKLGKYSEAYNIYKKIMDTSDPKMHPLFRLKLFDKKTDTQKIAKMNYNELHDILFNKEKALSYWKKKLNNNDSSMGNRNLSNKFKSGNESKSQKLQPNNKQIPNDIELLNNISYLLYKLERGNEATQYQKQALEIYPDDKYALKLAHDILDWAGSKKRDIEKLYSKLDSSKLRLNSLFETDESKLAPPLFTNLKRPLSTEVLKYNLSPRTLPLYTSDESKLAPPLFTNLKRPLPRQSPSGLNYIATKDYETTIQQLKNLIQKLPNKTKSSKMNKVHKHKKSPI